MEIKAEAKGVRVSTRKIRLVADAIRGLSADQAVQLLTMTRKHGAYPLLKVLQSALGNAKQNAKVTMDGLMIAKLEVNEGPFLKRFHASTRGRIKPYKKRTSHITVFLTEKKEEKKEVKK